MIVAMLLLTRLDVNTSKTESTVYMVLLGLGFRHLSMAPIYMHQVKKLVRSVSIAECVEMVDSLLKLEDTEDIENMVRKKFKEKFYDLP